MNQPGVPLRAVSDIYDEPWVAWTVRTAGLHLHPGRELATARLAERAIQFGFPPGGRILEVASALGGPARFLARQFSATIICLDMSLPMHAALTTAANAEGLSRRCLSVCARTERMPLADASLDAAWSQDAMCHMDKSAVVAEVSRVLKPGAIFAFTDWIARRRLEPEDAASLAALWGFPSLLRLAEYAALLDQCGFDLLLAEDRTPALSSFRAGAPWDDDLFAEDFARRWGPGEVQRQRAPGEVWQTLMRDGKTGVGMFIGRRR